MCEALADPGHNACNTGEISEEINPTDGLAALKRNDNLSIEKPF